MTNYQQIFDQIALGDTASVVEAVAGKPLVDSYTGDMRVMQFGSQAPSLAQYLYLKNDRVIYKSTSWYGVPRSFEHYLSLYGTPDTSLRQYAVSDRDSLAMTVHIWPDKGLTVTTNASFIDSPVIRVDQFSPVSLEEYMATWGKTLTGHERAVTSGRINAITPTRIVQPVKSNQISGISGLYIGGGIVLGALVFVLIARKIVMRGKKAENTVPPPLS